MGQARWHALEGRVCRWNLVHAHHFALGTPPEIMLHWAQQCSLGPVVHRAQPGNHATLPTGLSIPIGASQQEHATRHRVWSPSSPLLVRRSVAALLKKGLREQASSAFLLHGLPVRKLEVSFSGWVDHFA